MGHALVVGLGVSGQAAARYLQEKGNNVTVADDFAGEAQTRRAEELRAEGVEIFLGLGLGKAAENAAVQEHAAELLEGKDLVVASPGVPPFHPLLTVAREQGVQLWSEIELAFRACVAPIVAVTGTNGKSTVTTLIGRIFEAAGVPVAVCGNIGTPMIVMGPRVPPEGVVVAEVSSFQLALTEKFRARVGVLLNIAEDHFDWHLNVDDYAKAKTRVWANQTEDDLCLYNADDALVASLAFAAPGRKVAFSYRDLAANTMPQLGDCAREHVKASGREAPRPAPKSLCGGETGQVLWAGWQDEKLLVAGVGACPLEIPCENQETADKSLPAYLRSNYAAAAAVCVDMGVPPDSIGQGFASFVTLPHRMETVAVFNTVTFVDDSKATNPHAAQTAISSYEKVVLIAGGRNKGLDLTCLAEAAGHVRAVVGIGEAGPEIEAVFRSAGVPAVTGKSMREAVQAAVQAAYPGDTVLLSPACASFDWYRNYEARGEDFVEAVQELYGADVAYD